METTQGNSLCGCLYLKLAKTSCFSYHLSFFFYKIRKQEGGTGSRGVVEREEVVEKVGRRMNMVQIVCTHVCKCKNDIC
jgi:hypothetical protein